MSNAPSVQRIAKKAEVYYRRKEYHDAARTYREASQAFALEGHELEAAEMANNSSVAYLSAGEPESALEAVEGTAEIFAQADDMRRQGMALGNLAAALDALNRLDEAAQAYQQSAELLLQAGEEKLYADAIRALSSLQLRSGQAIQALVTMQAGLEGVRRPTPGQNIARKVLRIPFDMIKKDKP